MKARRTASQTSIISRARQGLPEYTTRISAERVPRVRPVTGRSIPGVMHCAPQFPGRGRRERPVTGRARGRRAYSKTTVSPHVEHSSPHAGPHAGMHSGPQTGADPHQPCVGERNSMKDGRRQLLPKQLQPDAATTTVRTITHDTIRDIVGFSSPRQSAEPTDDTSIRDRGEKTVAHRYDTGGLRVAFSSRARGGTVRLRESGKHC